MIPLYAKRMLTTMNLVTTVFEQGSLPNITCQLMVPREKMKLLVNLVSEKVIRARLLVESLIF